MASLIQECHKLHVFVKCKRRNAINHMFFSKKLTNKTNRSQRARSGVQSQGPGSQDFPGHWFPGSLVLEGTRGQKFLVLPSFDSGLFPDSFHCGPGSSEEPVSQGPGTPGSLFPDSGPQIWLSGSCLVCLFV